MQFFLVSGSEPSLFENKGGVLQNFVFFAENLLKDTFSMKLFEVFFMGIF